MTPENVCVIFDARKGRAAVNNTYVEFYNIERDETRKVVSIDRLGATVVVTYRNERAQQYVTPIDEFAKWADCVGAKVPAWQRPDGTYAVITETVTPAVPDVPKRTTYSDVLAAIKACPDIADYMIRMRVSDCSYSYAPFGRF